MNATESNAPWRFVAVADMQPGSPRSYRFRPAWLENWRTARKQIVAMNPDLILVGGDLTRDGTLHRWELEEMKADLDSTGIPYRVIPGNMDVGNKHTAVEGPLAGRRDTELGIRSQWLARFEAVFGPSRWTFVHKNVRFSGFCDLLLGSGLPEEAELLDWLDVRRRRGVAPTGATDGEGSTANPATVFGGEGARRADHHIWLMHCPLFVDRPDEKTWDIRREEEYRHWYFTVEQSYRERLFAVFAESGADRVITGHVHCRKDHYARGIHFDLAPSTAFSQWDDHWVDGDPTLGFYRFDVAAARFEKTFVPLERVSTRTDGYGPGGHPPPEERDYSRAWER